MNNKRKDSKGRNLRLGEFQDKEGRYRFTFYVNGQQRCIYSWKLEEADPLPKGKRPCKALRTQIKELHLEQGMGINIFGGFVTVEMLAQRFISIQKKNRKIKPKTIAGYETAMKRISGNEFCQKRINIITQTEAIEYIQDIQNDTGLGFSAIKSIHSLLNSACDRAMKDKLIMSNPFDFTLAKYIEDDSVERIPLEKEEKEKLIKFIKEHPYYNQYGDVVEFLFESGLRISELCGLTTYDIDFETGYIDIHKQLYRHEGSYVIVTPKSKKSKRKIPISDRALECLQHITNKRSKTEEKVKVLGYSGFLTFDRDGKPRYGEEYAHIFKNIWEAYKKENEVKPEYTFTPHICRHTYATEMVNRGMDIKILSELLGHYDVRITYKIYVHMTETQKEAELVKLGLRRK